MITKVDNEKLEQHIGELNALYNKWSGYQKKQINQGENGGGTVTQIVELTKTLQEMQNAFTLLISNTLSYMRQRKASVEQKDNKAATELQK